MSMNILKKLRDEIKSKEKPVNSIRQACPTAAVQSSSSGSPKLVDNVKHSDLLTDVRIKFSSIERQIRFDNFPCLGSIPSIYYIPNIISIDEEQQILSAIQTEGIKYNTVWKVLKTRRLQLWEDTTPISSSDVTTSSTPSLGFPKWLHDTIQHLLINTGVFDANNSTRPNHVLINDYAIGEGILHHTDGPSYFPHVAILSLNSPCLMTFRKRLESCSIGTEFNGDLFSVVLKPRSLLVFNEEMYSDYMHGIVCDVDHDIVGKKIGCDYNYHFFNDTNQAIITSDDVSNNINKDTIADSEFNAQLSSSTTILPCINKIQAQVNDGDIIKRGPRTSLTFRHIFKTSFNNL